MGRTALEGVETPRRGARAMRLDAHEAFTNLASYGKDRSVSLHTGSASGMASCNKEIGAQNQQPRPPLPPHRARAAACGRSGPPWAAPSRLPPAVLRIPDFAKISIKDTRPPPHPPVDGGRVARVLGPLILIP
jgi:hypothetical protein